MLTTILSQNQVNRELQNSISSFFSDFGIRNLLHRCNAQKEKGVPAGKVFLYNLCNAFMERSMYM